MRFPLYIARKYLFSRKKQNAINIISLISMSGVAIGASALVVILSVINGFDEVVESLFNSFDPEIKITAKEGKVFSPDASFDEIKKIDGLIHFSEVLEENALLRYGEKEYIATIKGVDESFIKVTEIDSTLVDGEMILKDKNRAYAIVGQGVAYSLQIGLNFINPIFIYVPKRLGKINLANPDDALKRKFIYPKGIFSIEQDYDSKYVIVPIEVTRELLEYTDEVSAIEIKLDPKSNVSDIQKEIKTKLGPAFEVKNREEQNELFHKVMKSEKTAIFLILSLILIIASFNIIGSLSMLIIDKKADIKSLRNMGASKNVISRIFLVEGWLISIIGSFIGILLGSIISWVQDTFGLLKLGGGGGSFIIDAYPMDLRISDVFVVWITVLFIGFLAALYPVKQISKRYLARIDSEVVN